MDVQREVVPINGNGFCFISSLVVAMEKDHQIMISNPEARRLILQHLTDYHQKYLDFYRINTPEGQHISEHVTDSDMFLTEVIDFFEDRNFDRDVVDLLVKICADALGLDVFIYQDNYGPIEVLKYSRRLCCRPVYVKFSHNNMHSLGNHYEAVTKKKTNLKLQKFGARKETSWE